MMKAPLKIFGVLLFSAATLISACNTDTKTSDAPLAQAHDHGDHGYSCPMHPEVTGHEGDNCPKCGMKLVKTDASAASDNQSYLMKFSTLPASVNVNKEVTLTLTPQIKGNETQQVPLDIEHEKKIHLIVVNEDLSYFDHIHPELNADGSYTVKTTFPVGGKFTLFADYKPTGGNHTVDKLPLTVEGGKVTNTLYAVDKLSATSDEFTVNLTPANGKLITSVPLHLTGMVMQNGKEVDVNTLENYLGAKAHMVVISRNDKEYLHVHPGVEGGKFDLHTTFEKPGIYRGWIQFQSKGKVRTTDFVFNVKEATEAEKQNAAAQSKKDESPKGHAHH